jgi:two-component system phosphate regulon sensor histidine kinase PhoR
MKRSIFIKIFIGYFLIIILLASLILFFSLRTIRNFYLSSLTGKLAHINATLAENIIPLLLQQSYGELDSEVKQFGKVIATRITIIDTSGVVLADSEKDPLTMENHRNRPEVQEALSEGRGTSLRYSITIDEEMLYVAQPIKNDDTIIGIIRCSLFLKDIRSLLGNIRKAIIQISFVLIALSLIGAFIIARTFSSPIRALVDGTRKVASGDFDAKVFLDSKDELRELADNFNTMTERIKLLFTDLTLEKEELDRIISSLQQGLLVIDKNGTITMANYSAKKLLQISAIEGKSYWEVLREPNLTALLEHVQKQQEGDIREIELNGRVFVSSATYIPGKEEIALIFHDITKSRDLEKIKKDFVVNVSHELRTPLTAIKGFVETLGEEVDKKHKRYLEVINRHTERLIHIVNDLLLLSELEERRSVLQLEKVSLKNLIENVIRIYSPKLERKSLSLRLQIESNLPKVQMDPFKMEQLLINLIDNAISYTEKGSITISVKQQDDQISLEVADTGIGIAPQDLPRIFERFYVVDKSRSRHLGGTGLGLSIVKHIVLLHNGSIAVESTPGVGTKFTISIPLS